MRPFHLLLHGRQSSYIFSLHEHQRTKNQVLPIVLSLSNRMESKALSTVNHFLAQHATHLLWSFKKLVSIFKSRSALKSIEQKQQQKQHSMTDFGSLEPKSPDIFFFSNMWLLLNNIFCRGGRCYGLFDQIFVTYNLRCGLLKALNEGKGCSTVVESKILLRSWVLISYQTSFLFLSE